MAHEVGHCIIPWHEAMMHGDRQQTLSATCHARLEIEANYAASRLLFMRDRFRDDLMAAPISFARLIELSEIYGNTITSTLWQTVEVIGSPALALVTSHPRQAPSDGRSVVQYFLRSQESSERFAGVRGESLFTPIARNCSGTDGLIGSGEVTIHDTDSEAHTFFVETFYNSYDALSLGTHLRPR